MKCYIYNQKINDGHKKIYQSKDDLNKRIEFSKITTYMEKFINTWFQNIYNLKLN